MPPTRHARRSREFTVPYHRFLGPGTNLEDLKYLPALNRLDWAMKRHDFNYGDPKITTKEADEQFYRESQGTGFLEAASKAALKAKSALGVDSYFRPGTDLVHTSPERINNDAEIMADQDASTVADSDAGGENGWTGTSTGGALLPESGNEIRSYVIKRRFKNIVKTTDMYKANGHFQKYTGSEKCVHNIGHFCWNEPESGDYIVPYFLTTWVTIPKWEATLRNAMSYRVKRQGFTIDNVVCGEWLTKNNEKVFVPNPEPYFYVYVDHGQYIGYGNLVGITKVPNKDFREIQPMNGNDVELPKYKYIYGAPIHMINKVCTGNPIDADNISCDIQMIKLHD